MSKLQQLKTTPPYDEPWKVATLVNLLATGKSNSLGQVTLSPSATSTVLKDNNIRPGSKLFFTPITAHAASVTGLWYDPSSVPELGGAVTLQHAAVSQADLSFDYMILT
ncbi:MAG TPA: hypothetical protein VGM16_09160 [Gammaproteobacteria bacterium]|jgi:hypothetical protein